MAFMAVRRISAGRCVIKREVVSGVFWIGNGQVVRILTTFGTIAVLARFLGPDDFGIISGVMMVALIANFIGDFGLGAAVIQRPEVDDKLLSCVFWLNVAISLLLALIVALTAEQISDLFQLPAMTDPLRVGALIFPLTAVRGAWRAILEKSLKFKKVALAEMIGTVVGSLAAIASVLLGADIWALVIQQLVIAGGASIAFMGMAGWRPKFFFSFAMSQPILAFGANLTVSLLIGLIAKFIHRPIISRSLGVEALGHYSIAVQLVDYPVRNLAQILQRIMFPAFSKAQTDNERMRKMHRSTMHGVSLVIWPIMVGLAAISDTFVTVLMGPNWELTAKVLAYLAPAGAIAATTGINNTIFLAKNRPDLQMRTSIFAATLAIIFLLIGLQYGLMGIAIAQLAAVSITLPVVAWFALSLIEQSKIDILKVLLPILVSCGIMYGAVTYLKSALALPPLLELIVCVPVGVLIYVACELLLDRKQLFHVLSSLFSRSKGNQPAQR